MFTKSRFSCFAFLIVSFVFSASAGTYEDELKTIASNMGQALEKAGLKTVAFASFKDLQGKETNLGKLLAEDLSAELVNYGKGVSVVDRSNLNRLMEDKKLTEAGLLKQENTKELKLAGIDAVIFGTIVPLEGTYRVNLRAVATESAMVVAATRNSITETDSLNSLIKVANVQQNSILGENPATATPSPPPTIQLSKSSESEVKSEEIKKQSNFDFGPVILEIKSVIFNKKAGTMKMTFVATNRGRNSQSFAYCLMDKNAPDVDLTRYNSQYRNGPKPDYGIRGEATDDKGNSYLLLLPSDAQSRPRLSQGTPVAFTLEYQIKGERGSTVQIPSSISLWFEFYIGLQVGSNLNRLSLVEYSLDKVQ